MYYCNQGLFFLVGLIKLMNFIIPTIISSFCFIITLMFNVIFGLQEGMAYDLIIGTTKIVSGSTLIETFIDKLG